MSSKLPRLRFYLDENFPVPAGKFLKSIRQSVKFVVYDKNARSKSDLWQLKQATKLKRIFLALDRDFTHQESLMDLIRKSPGVILVHSSDPSSEKIKQILHKLIKKLESKKLSGKICVATVDKISLK